MPVRTIVFVLLSCAVVGWVVMAPGAAARQPMEAAGMTAHVQLPKFPTMSPSVVTSVESATPPHGGGPRNSIYQPAPNVHIALTRPAAEQAQLATAGAGGAPSSTTNMTYNGGPTQQTLVAYTIFWSPHSTISSSYRTLINRYFQDIGGSSFYNIVSQYPGLTDTQNVSTLGGTWIDTSAYPAGAGSAVHPLSDADIEDEVARALGQNSSWTPAGLGRMYFVYTESGIESCFDPTATYSDLSCTSGVSSPASKQYCAYHSWFGTDPVIYANMPYGETWPDCQGLFVSPNGDLAADEEISISSHEHFEAVTDPFVGAPAPYSAWFDSDSTGEIGDKCAYKYGSIMPDGHNLTLNGHPYIAQLEWSNANNNGVTPFSGCVDRWGAFNFLWYADNSANPVDPNACELAKPIPPNGPYATGLCASFDLQLPVGDYSLRSIWQLNGSIFSDATFPNTHLYSGTWNLSYRGLTAGGTYSLILYANGVLLGSGSVTVSGTTPTPTPTGQLIWEDVDCSGAVNPVDSLKVLKMDAGFPVTQTVPGCPAIGANVMVGGMSRLWGDGDCSGSVNPIDLLKTLKTDAGIHVSQTVAGCPDFGSLVTLGSGSSLTPTQTPTSPAGPHPGAGQAGRLPRHRSVTGGYPR